MRKIAIFAEGQTELIFIRNFLLRVLDPSKISFECYELLSHQQFPVNFQYPNSHADIHFFILDVHGDESVVSYMKEREKNFIEEQGYETIIGLRDLYCEEYIKRSPGVINNQISNMIIQGSNQTINNMRYADKIKLYFAIMEVEAWFLGMYTLFQKIDSILTMEYIKQNLKIDLKTADPQKEFYRPSDQVDSIFQLLGREYKKKQSELESICSNIDSIDFVAAMENNRCACLADFYKEITSYN